MKRSVTYRSDMWREKRYDDKARETAYVTRAIADGLITYAEDSRYQVTWKPIDGTVGATNTAARIVRLSPQLIEGLTAPFNGRDVDKVMGVAAHEAGHALIAGDEKTARELPSINDSADALVMNIIQDMMIDCGAFMRHNPALGSLTANLRAEMKSEQEQVCGAVWRGEAELSPLALWKLYGVSKLEGFVLPALKHRRQYASTLAKFDAAIAPVMAARAMLGTHAGQIMATAHYAIIVALDEEKSRQDRAERLAQAKREREQAKKDADAERQRREQEKQREKQEQEQSAEKSEAPSKPEQSEEDAESADDSAESDDTGAESGESDEDADEQGNEPSEDKSAGSGDTEDDEEDADADESGDSDDADDSGDEDGQSADDEPSERINEPSAGSEDEDEGQADADDQSGESGESGEPKQSDESADADEPQSDQGGERSDTVLPPERLTDDEIADACPNHDADEHDADELASIDEFWRDVVNELDRIEAAQDDDGLSNLAPYTDDETTAEIKALYERLASEPDRSRREYTGRVDKRRMIWGVETDRTDIFTRWGEQTIGGTLVLLLDMSYSTNGVVPLIKQAAASMYQALVASDVQCYIYAYGLGGQFHDGDIAELANPKRVSSRFDQARAAGGTDTASAFEAVTASVALNPTGHNVILHVTDGSPSHIDHAIDVMEETVKSGWSVINVMVGSIPIGYVRQCRARIGTVAAITSYEQLPAIIEEAITRIMAEEGAN